MPDARVVVLAGPDVARHRGRERSGEPVGEEDPQERTDEGAGHLHADDRCALVDRLHRQDDAEHRGDDPQRGEGVGECLNCL